MTNVIAALLLSAAAASSPSPISTVTPEPGTAGSTVPAPNGVEITWHGQSCFLMRTPGGTTVLMDPVAYEIGYKPPTVKADLVTISHEHPDHNNLKMVEVVGVAAGGANVIHGLTDKGDWADVDASVGDVHVTTVDTYHDDVKGKRRGKNAAFVFEVTDGTQKRRIVHLGDLGQTLDKQQIAAFGKIDVLMIPIGGHYTIDAKQAQQVIEQLKPTHVILPMHYKTPQLKIKELAPRDAFAALHKHAMELDANRIEIDSSGMIVKKGADMRYVSGSMKVTLTGGGTRLDTAPGDAPMVIFLKVE